jgi:predicted nucleic acid-binding protein
MNKKSIFVDTGAWFAVADKSDQFHRKAVSTLQKLTHDGFVLLTSNLVVHETVMLLTRKISKHAAITFLEKIHFDDRVEIFHADEIVEREAYQFFRSYDEHDFSITDCVSFVLMKRHGVKQVFTFDKHFKTMRFSVEP